MGIFFETLKHIQGGILGLLYPIRCVGCGKSDVYICSSCMETIGDPIDNLPKDTFARFDYRNEHIKKLVWMLKYHGKKSIGKELGGIMHELLISIYAEENEMHPLGKAILIPIPLSRKRSRSRGYNQATLLAEGMITADNGKHFMLGNGILEKTRDTERQALLTNRSKRLSNLHGCFTVRDETRVRGKTVVIVDDVTTTGGTLNEAHRVLKAAGAKKIFAVTIAH